MFSKRRAYQRPTSKIPQDWRSYQQMLKRENHSHDRIQRRNRWTRRIVGVVLGLLAIITIGPYLLDWAAARLVEQSPPAPIPTAAVKIEKPPLLQFSQVRKIVGRQSFLNMTTDRLTVAQDPRRWEITTSLMPTLQKDLLGYLDRKHSRYIGIVAMAPDGRILAMVGYDRTKSVDNVCTLNGYPAASLFKIVTAAAAIEKLGLTTTSPMAFNGSKYTLYKRQLTAKRNRYTHVMPFADAFAESVNPVFGKLGALKLGKVTLDRYAFQFGFNQDMPFEKQIAPSRFKITDRSYQWAEIASGFNRTTTISPLHAAMIAAIQLNHGRLAAPTVVDRIYNSEGDLRYQREAQTIRHAVKAETGQALQTMMQSTVRKGTARNAFRRLKRDKVLSDKRLGGKTGSIYNTTRDAKIDWFAGYAVPKSGSPAIVVAIVVAHEKYIGRRAAQYARYLFKRYFQLQLQSQDQTDTVYSG